MSLRARIQTLLVAAVLVPWPQSARGDGPVKFTLDAPKSTLKYKVVHPFHETEGKTSALEGVALVKPEGGAMVQIKADLRTFDSGNSNRDDHMKESTEANKFPFVTLKGLLKDFKLPATYPADVNVSLDGELELHGVKHPITVPIALHFDSAASAKATAQFDVSLDAYQIDRPSMMMRKIDDACHMSVDLTFAAAPK